MEMNLRIAVIAFNARLTDTAVRVLADQDAAVTKRKYSNASVMTDGTIYEAVTNREQLRGVEYDQLIICDDPRRHVYAERWDLIEAVKQRIKPTSCVPEELQVQEYIW